MERNVGKVTARSLLREASCPISSTTNKKQIGIKTDTHIDTDIERERERVNRDGGPSRERERERERESG